MKKMIAGALFGLVVLGAERAEANMKLNLVVRSCDPAGNPWKQTDQDGRLGRLTIKDQMGEVVQTQDSVHFSASRCQATLTATFTATALDRFLDPADPLFLTLEACANGSAACTFANGVLDSKPTVFQAAPIDSLLPDLVGIQQEALEAEMAARVAADQAEAEARADADTAEATARAAAINVEKLRALAAEQDVQDGLAAEVTRAMAAEVAEEGARQSAIAAEATARADAIAAEAQARVDAIAAEAAARIQAISDEAVARGAAVSAEATARADADADARTYVDATFLPLAGGTVDGDLTVDGILHVRGGVSWDACPAGVDALERTFEAAQGTTSRLCASAFQQTEPSVQIDDLLTSYIEPLCPMVVRIAQNYTEIGGPMAVSGIDLLLGKAASLLNEQITPFAQGLLDTTTAEINGLVDSVNNKVAEVNALVAASTATVNGVIDAYNGLVADLNAALAASTGGLNDSIAAIDAYLAAVRNSINGVVVGINAGVADVNSAFAAIDSSLGSTADALNAFNSSPAAINGALGTLSNFVTGRLGTLNNILDEISATRAAIVGGINGRLQNVDAHLTAIVGGVNQLDNVINEQIVGPINTGFNSVQTRARLLANGVVDQVNTFIFRINDKIIGPGDGVDANRRGINGVLDWLSDFTGGVVALHYLQWIPGISEYGAADDVADMSVSWSYDAPASVGRLGAPAPVAHVGGIDAPVINSLGLPHFDLGLAGASMRQVAVNLGAPALAGVQAPQLTGAELDTLTPAAIPPIPHVEIPAIPAWDGFQLEGAIDFAALSNLLGDLMDPICANVHGSASSYLHAYVGEVPELVPAYSDADAVCRSLGAHVCDANEIVLLAGDGEPGDLGYGMGDWTDDGRVMFNQAATSGFMIDVEWPFLHPDASKLMSFPPGFPFTFTPPVLPTGRFRCCASSE